MSGSSCSSFDDYTAVVLRQIHVDDDRRARIATRLRAQFDAHVVMLRARGFPEAEAGQLVLQGWGDPENLRPREPLTALRLWGLFLFAQVALLWFVIPADSQALYGCVLLLAALVLVLASRRRVGVAHGLVIQGPLTSAAVHPWDALRRIDLTRDGQKFRGRLRVELTNDRRTTIPTPYRGSALSVLLLHACMPGLVSDRVLDALAAHVTRIKPTGIGFRLAMTAAWVMVGCRIFALGGWVLRGEFWPSLLWVGSLAMLILLMVQRLRTRDPMKTGLLHQVIFLVFIVSLAGPYAMIACEARHLHWFALVLFGCVLCGAATLWLRRRWLHVMVCATVALAMAALGWVNYLSPVPTGRVLYQIPLHEGRILAQHYLDERTVAVLVSRREDTQLVVVRDGAADAPVTLPAGYAQFITPPPGRAAAFTIPVREAVSPPGTALFPAGLNFTQHVCFIGADGRLEPFATPYDRAESYLLPPPSNPWSPDGRRVAFSTYDKRAGQMAQRLRIVDRASGAEIYADELKGLVAVAWRSDTTVRAINRDDGVPAAHWVVRDIDTATSQVQVVDELNLLPDEVIALLPGLAHVLLTTRVHDFDLGVGRVLEQVGNPEATSAWHAPTRRLVYGNRPPAEVTPSRLVNGIRVVTIGSSVTQHVDLGLPHHLLAMQLSPDGTQLAIARRAEGDFGGGLGNLLTRTQTEWIDLNRGIKRLLDSEPGIFSFVSMPGREAVPSLPPQWSPSGQRLLEVRQAVVPGRQPTFMQRVVETELVSMGQSSHAQ